jgi:hypothetical protein
MRIPGWRRKNTKRRTTETLDIAEASLTAGEAGIVLIIGGLVLAGIGVGLTLRVRDLRANRKAAR